MNHTIGNLICRKVDDQEYAIDAPDGDETLGYKSWKSMASVFGADDDPENGSIVAKANAERLVACWNACDGIPTDALNQVVAPGHSPASLARSAEMWQRQRDELLAELKSAIENIDFKHEAYASAYTLIAKIEAAK